MRGKVVLFTVFLMSCMAATAQSGFEYEWRNGKVYLNNGDTLAGQIIYEEGHEIVQFRYERGDPIDTYSSFSLMGFQMIVNDTTKTLYRFYWDGGKETTMPVPEFFEVLYDGKFKLLSKERKVKTLRDDDEGSSIGVGGVQTMIPVYTEEIWYNFFFMDEHDTIQYIPNAGKYFTKRFPTYRAEIKAKTKKMSSIKTDQELMVELVKHIEMLYFLKQN